MSRQPNASFVDKDVTQNDIEKELHDLKTWKYGKEIYLKNNCHIPVEEYTQNGSSERKTCCHTFMDLISIMCKGIGRTHTKIERLHCLLRPFLYILYYVFTLPSGVTSYITIIFASEVMIIVLVLDLWDTFTDIILITQARDEPISYQVWITIALVFGVWNLVYEVMWMFKSRYKTMLFKVGTMFGKFDVFHIRIHYEEESVTLESLTTSYIGTFLMFDRCASEDGLVMVAALVRGKKISGLGEIIAFTTSLVFTD